jgi:hypothetical protein
MKRIVPAIMLLLLVGCAVTRPHPKIDPATLDRDSFLSWLADQPMVSAAEAYRAMLLAATDQDPGSDFAQNQQEVFRRDIARPEWKLQPDQAVDKATVAFMALQVAKVRGGINLNLFGRALHLGDRRYAFREAVYEGAPWDATTPYMVLTGGEFVSLLTWADERRDKTAEPATLPRPSAATQPTAQ